MAAVNAAKFGLQLAVLPILARILDPSSFGLVALAMPFVLAASVICDFGLGSAIVRERETSRELGIHYILAVSVFPLPIA